MPETCRVVITINLEVSASLGFIHKDLVISTVIHKFDFTSKW